MNKKKMEEKLHPSDPLLDKLKDDHGSFIRKVFAQNYPSAQKTSCSIPHLKNALRIPETASPDCKRIKPDLESCKIAQEKFVIDNADRACENLATGDTRWTTQESLAQLQDNIRLLLTQESAGYCLIHCGEEMADDYINDFSTAEYQILNLPPFVTRNEERQSDESKMINFNFVFIDSVSRHHFFRMLPKTTDVLDDINVRESNNKDMVVDFELIQGVKSRTFESLQTLFSGEIDPYSKPFGIQAMPKTILKIHKLLRPFKALDFKTLWMEDLCPFWEWGISKDLLVYDKFLENSELWQKLSKTLKKSHIDSFGNTHASCRILNRNGVPDPFHGPETVCYNGMHHHEYQLEYLTLYQKTLQKHSQNFFSFFETNVGHEDTGLRTKYLDSSLSEYLKFVRENLKSTLTVIFSDHGNAYGPYIEDTAEGRLETYQPFLFMIIPERVQSLFTRSQLDALIVNQQRLVSMLDVHYTIKYIIMQLSPSSAGQNSVSEFNKQFNVTEYGLFKEVSRHQTCSLIPRVMPNLCICEGYDVPSDNYAYHYLLAQYFVGMMNNEILAQRSRSRGVTPVGGFGRCHRMKVQSVKNVQLSNFNEKTKLARMDLYVTTPGQNQSEIFFITLYITDKNISTGAFERITPYSTYSKCVDNGVELQLCICDKNTAQLADKNTTLLLHKNTARKTDKITALLSSGGQGTNRSQHLRDGIISTGSHSDSFISDKFLHSRGQNDTNRFLQDLTHTGMNISIVSNKEKKCLYLIEQSNYFGVMYDVVNLCRHSVSFTYDVKSRNLKLMSSSLTKVTLLPGDIKCVHVGVMIDTDKVWSSTFHFHI
ncbi:hypothetical protein MAR_022263 [Mya arenaria]|uniref:Uncharacterized protein n=1 Tax=Mya arenaria TaxID=6604 RepID=A0ABY7DMH7_MYAAR|nr:hypothetical protein MAR_022263 [Mya arenaria]